MNLDDLSCQICLEQFDLGTHLPRILTECGHTLCSECLALMLVQNPEAMTCPHDRGSIQTLNRKLESFPVNFSLRRLLEGQPSEDRCPKHNLKREYQCLKDKELICDKCLLKGGDHHHHKCKAISKLRAEIEKKVARVEEDLNRLDMCLEEGRNVLKETRDSFIRMIEFRFQEIVRSIKLEEALLTHQVHEFFKSRGVELSKVLGDESSIRGKLVEKVSSYRQALNTQDFIGLIDSDPEEALPIVSQEVFQRHTQDLAGNLIAGLNCWEESVKLKIDSLLNTTLPMKNLAEIYHEYLHKSIIEPLNVELQAEPSAVSFRTALTFEIKQDTLHITAQNIESVDTIMNLDGLENVHKVELQVNRTTISREDGTALYYIWRLLPEISSFQLICRSRTIQEYNLANLLYLISSKISTVTDFEFNLFECRTIADATLSILLQNILPRMTKLKNLSLDFTQTRITDDALMSFSRYNALILQSLEKLRISLSQTSITNKGAKCLFVPMPSVIEFAIYLKATDVTDESIVELAKDSYANSESLRELCLNFSRMSVTDKGIVSTFINFQKLRVLHLYLAGTSISSQALKVLGTDCLANMEVLENLCLILSNTNIEDDDLAHICVPIPALKKLSLFFPMTNITENGLQLLSSTMLSSSKLLEWLKIDLTSVDVTNAGVEVLLQNLNSLSYFNFILSQTKITDQFGIDLINDILPKMKRLNDFAINTWRTGVSMTIQDNIERYRRRHFQSTIVE